MKTLAQFLGTITLRQAVSLLLIVCMLHLNVAAVKAMSGADPQTSNVAVGPIAAEGVTTVTVNAGAGSAKAIVNWQDMNISDRQTLEFVRDGGAFVVLNRDMQSNATRIDGSILGNQGHIIVINQNGIIFGPSASVEAAKFTAGAMAINDQDFLNQDSLKFIVTDGAVENMGKITAEQVALIGREVINRGIIQTPAGGFVMLASADEVFLAEDQDSHVMVRLSSTPEFNGQVTNEQEGSIDAPAGTIILAAGDLYVQALDDLGGLSASVETGAGRVGQFGTMTANGIDGNAGNIALAAGQTVALGQDSLTSANAGANGDGGQIIVYSPDTALFRNGARVEAKGGSQSGNGGFFDLSGKEYVEVAGDIDMTAAKGNSGTFLIDPRNIKVVASGSEEGNFDDPSDIWQPTDDGYVDSLFSSLPIDLLEQYLLTSSVILETNYASPSRQTGWVRFDAGRDVQNSADTSLTVNAKNYIIMDSGINFTGSGDITLNAQNDMAINSALAAGGNIALNANKDIYVNAALASGGDLNIIADSDHDVFGDMISASGAALTAGGNIDIRGNDIDMGDAVTAGGNLTITGRDCENPDPEWGNIHARKTLTAGGDIVISDTGEKVNKAGLKTYFPGTITLDGDVTAGGSISLYNDTYATNVTGNGVTLRAGQDIRLMNDIPGPTAMNNCTQLQGEHYLALIAGGQIEAENTLIEVTGSTLKLEHNPDLDLKNFLIGNQVNTDLIANSTGGSVIIVNAANGGKDQNAADQWKSIESTAQQNITLQGNGDIRAKTLHAIEGNIAVTSSHDDIFGSGPITADSGNITLTAMDDIMLSDDVTAGGNIKMSASDYTIYLGGDTVADGYVWLTANTKLNGSGDQVITAGDWMRADGSVRKITNGDLNIAGNSGIWLADDVSTFRGNLVFEDEVIAFGFGNQSFDADGSGKDLIARSDIRKVSGGNLTLDAGSDPHAHIYLAGDVTTENGNITFEDDVIANGCGNQKFDAGGYGSDLIAKDDITKTTHGNLTLDASDYTIYLAGDVTTEDGDLNFNAKVVANGLGDQRFDAGGYYNDLTAQGDICKTTGGDLTLDAGKDPYAHIYLAGDVTTQNGDITFEDDVIANGCGDQEFDAGGFGSDLIAKDDIAKTTHGNLTLDASDHTIYLAGDVTTEDGDLNFNAPVIANGWGDQRFDAGGLYNDLTAQGDISKTTCGDLTLDAGRDPHAHIFLAGDVTTQNGDITFEDDVIANGWGSQRFDAGGFGSDLTANDDITKTTCGDLTLDAGKDPGAHIYLAGDVVNEKGSLTFEEDVIADGQGDQSFRAEGFWSDLTAEEDITKITSGNLHLEAVDDVYAKGDLTAELGGISIDASDNTIYLGGNVTAQDFVHLMANTKLNGNDSQYIDAGSYIAADGFVRKCTWGDLFLLGRGADEGGRSLDLRYTSDGFFDPAVSTWMGNIWMIGAEDIQVSGDVTTFGPSCCYGYWGCGRPTGGVLMYSLNGSIYTDGYDGLNVNVTGNSDHWQGLGVFNPYYLTYYNDGSIGFDDYYGDLGSVAKAAIVIVSAEDLTLGPNGSLNAFGTYYDDVDDRALTNSLDVPANIGGYDRDEGDSYDWAIYARSLDGNVHVDMPTQILSYESVEPDYPDGPAIAMVSENHYDCCPQIAKGTMVVDAYDTITFGENFEQSIAEGQVGDRLEVISRITEWLRDAYGRLPYADPSEGDGPFPDGYAYVLRGAGLENPDITDGRAWVLEDLTAVPALYRPEEPRLSGCPVEMDAAAAELGVNADQLHVAIGNSLSLNPTLNPCSACARLVNAAYILNDADGSRMAALAAVFEQIAPADMPFTPEMGAAIATAFSQNAQADSRYAAAMEYVDAFVQYVTVVDRDLKAPVEDSVALVMTKYGNALMENGNTNMAAYVMMQIQQ